MTRKDLLNITPEMHDFLNERADMPRRQLTEELNQLFETNLTYEQVRGYCKRQGIMSGRNGQFNPGHGAWNKGFKSGGGPEHTRFPKGHKPWNWVPVGSERITSDGYLQRKMIDTGYPPRDWVEAHRLMWEEHNGPIPKGHTVIFIDGDKANIKLDNLALVNRSELAIINKRRLLKGDADMRNVGITMGKLIHKTAQRSREDK